MVAVNQTMDGQMKDTAANIIETGEFVYNMVTYDLREAMNKTAEGVPPQVDEFELAGLTKALSVLVKPFRVAESPVQMDVSFYTSLHLPGRGKEGSVDVSDRESPGGPHRRRRADKGRQTGCRKN
jgi:flavin reductase (DIM6/NTAB) family NADH-FMN oxidoreductase RutF